MLLKRVQEFWSLATYLMASEKLNVSVKVLSIVHFGPPSRELAKGSLTAFWFIAKEEKPS